MISPDRRFVSPASCQTPYSVGCDVNVLDLDTRHWTEVHFPHTALGDDDDPDYPELIAMEILQKHIKDLDIQVYKVTADRGRNIIAISRDPQDDPTLVPRYPKFDLNAYSLRGDEVLQMSELVEVDRLAARADLVNHQDSKGQVLAVFKYSLISGDLEAAWNEAHLLRAVCSHPFIVPFDKFIVEGVDSRFVGHTSKFVPGGTLQDDKTRPFHYIWLKQLTSVVDYLNLELGIDTQDIRPCNLLIDPIDNKLQLFDFEKAGRIGNPATRPSPWNYLQARNDVDSVIFTVYEILTHDYHFREATVVDFHWDVSQVENMSDWDIKRAIEGAPAGVYEIRHSVLDWAQRRRSQPVKNWEHAPQSLQVPQYPHDTAELLVVNQTQRQPYIWSDRRRQLIKEGQHVLFWERPASNYDTEVSGHGLEVVHNGQVGP